MTSCCELFTNLFFDVFAALVSISDIATDVIVTYNFYQQDRMIFFGLSLTFIILAQLSYIFAFIIQIGDENKPYRIFLMFLCLLPLSPLISFIFYLTENPDSFTSNLLKDHFCFSVDFRATNINNNKSKLRQWMKRKLRKHLGFIMESLIEAFPQSILQLTAIVVYNEANIVSIISILISMLSVSSKSFVLSIQFSMNIKTLFFNWFCACTDFIGIFFAVSWVFYDSQYQVISIMAYFWQIKVLCSVVPLVFGISIGLYWKGLYELLISMDSNSIISSCCGCFAAFLMVTLLWSFGMILGCLALEISTFLFIAFPMFVIGSYRMPTNADQNQLWLNVLSWINSSHSHKFHHTISLTKKQDKIIRIGCVNKIMIENKGNYPTYDKQFVQFIEKQDESYYMDIKSLSEFRRNHEKINFVNGPSPEFFPTILALMFLPYLITKGEIKNNNNFGVIERNIIFYGISVINFGIAPLYYLSRLINILYPFILLCLLYLNGINIFNDQSDIDLFQRVTLLLYISFMLILFILGIFVMNEQYILWHIMPTKEVRNTAISLEMIQDKYNGIVVIPVRDALLHEKYGPDIAKIVIEYCNAITLSVSV